ncbi:MAG: DUF1343 domain-containing protein [Flavobacteriia bacterium]|nr:DUF1343 domain-containing protein [Flavobacteriia bacterium]
MNTFFRAKDIQMTCLIALLVGLIWSTPSIAQPEPAADHPEDWLQLLEGKRIAVVANQTSRVGEDHLVDFLVANNIQVARVFSPEHGFRGAAAAGEHVTDGIDQATGLPIVSLYGNHKKPTPEEVLDLDLVLFDIQDVGVRFYTYVSTMTYVMEACAENGVSFMVLDRPNPHGNLIDGPILEPEFSSFVGLHPVPIAHGMTLAEYAGMVKGEGWITDAEKLNLSLIRCHGYTHQMQYELPVAPSPNLPNQASIMLYPSLCLFEGTPVSIGRGTDHPFQVIGAPWFMDLGFQFTPESRPQAPSPKYEGELCRGVELSSFAEDFLHSKGELYIFWLIEAHRHYEEEEPFFTSFFNLLAGTDKLADQIAAGLSEEQIRASWAPGLYDFKQTRSRYLLYP